MHRYVKILWSNSGLTLVPPLNGTQLHAKLEVHPSGVEEFKEGAQVSLTVIYIVGYKVSNGIANRYRSFQPNGYYTRTKHFEINCTAEIHSWRTWRHYLLDFQITRIQIKVVKLTQVGEKLAGTIIKINLNPNISSKLFNFITHLLHAPITHPKS